MTAIRTDRPSDERAMAATGGGKIRSRRYHIASKPYAKSKQQPGLISRVTDTVISIVPSWLQKYFKNGDGAEAAGGSGAAAAAPAAEQNSAPAPASLPNSDGEARPPALDGRDSPEPSTSYTEPSTSRASLNFQDHVLSRPPLNRAHLHFPPLDPSSPVLGGAGGLFSQPSTSAAPGPFTTSFSLVKEIKDNLSQHEDDNISTTSGFSSRASDKDVPTSKTASLPQLWSPETDRTHSGPQTTQSSLKKPAFNLSVFGTSSNSLNSTVHNSSQLGDSPFYPGKTVYGGAAAARRPRSKPSTPYQPPVRRQIKAKPAGAQPCGVTSATARRILQSLERMSSPLADAKRIPSAASSPLSAALDGTNLDLSNFQGKRKRLDSPLPPVKKLLVPSAASASGNRSVSFRPSLTPGGSGRGSDRTPKDTPTRQSPLLPEVAPAPSESTTSSSGPAYPLSSTPAVSSAGSGGGKMKRERSSTRPSSKRPDEDEVTEVPDLPAISLPISASSLPSFTFSAPPPTTSIAAAATPTATPVTPAKEALPDKEPPAASTPPCTPFTFSSPIVKATAASPPSFSPTAGFTFSAPVAKLGPSISNGKLTTPAEAAVKSTTSNSTEDFDGPFKPAKTLKQGSVLDLLKAPGFSSPVARTSPVPEAAPPPTDTESAASSSTSTTTTEATPSSSSSSSSSSSATTTASTGLGDLFKPPPGSWNCDVCMVQNKASDSTCAACTSPQPGAKPPQGKPAPASSAVLENSTSSAAAPAATKGFGAMFTPPAGTWDCDTCLVQNKPDAVKCVACETAKPGTGVKAPPPPAAPPALLSAAPPAAAEAAPAAPGFGDKFKKPEGAWECDTCLVQNKAQDTKCVACMSAKPGAAASSAPVSSAPAGGGPLLGLSDKFKKPEGAWSCDVCCVQNKAADVQCVACQSAKPGAAAEPKGFGSSAFGSSGSSAFGAPAASAGGFKFGASTDSTSGSGGFKFGGTLSDSASASSGGFKFGGSFGTSSSEAASKDTSSSSGFKFGGSTEGFTFGAASSDKKPEPAAATGSGFKFGGGIAFGAGAVSTESKPAIGGFSFGLSKSEETAAAASTTPSLSSTAAPAAATQEGSDGTPLAETAPASAPASAGSSVFGRLGEPGPTAAAPLGGPAFGSSSEAKEPAAPAFTFGKPEDKKDAAPAPPPAAAFTFSAAAATKEAEATPAPAAVGGGFSFSKPDLPKEQPTPPAFSFGKPADKSEAPAADAPAASFSFGQSAADAAAPKPAFNFMGAGAAAVATTTSPPSSSSTAPAPSLFGTANSTAPAPVPAAASAPSPFLFGQATSGPSDAPQAKTFLFGQGQDSQPAAPALNSTPAPAQPFLFGAAANAAPAVAAPSFSFGAAAPSAASSAAPSPAPSPFVFSSPAPGGFGAAQAPSFGSAFSSPAPSPFSAGASQPPAFGAKPNAASVFGQQANATPVFGGNSTAAPGGGFQFGVASGFGASNANTGLFTFGGGAAGPPAPSAAPSIAPQPSAPGGGFNFSQPPTFNIGSAKSTYTASPAGPQTITGRTFKKAVRRRK